MLKLQLSQGSEETHQHSSLQKHIFETFLVGKRKKTNQVEKVVGNVWELRRELSHHSLPNNVILGNSVLLVTWKPPVKGTFTSTSVNLLVNVENPFLPQTAKSILYFQKAFCLAGRGPSQWVKVGCHSLFVVMRRYVLGCQNHMAKNIF